MSTKISYPTHVSMYTHGGGIAYHDKELTFHFINEL